MCPEPFGGAHTGLLHQIRIAPVDFPHNASSVPYIIFKQASIPNLLDTDVVPGKPVYQLRFRKVIISIPYQNADMGMRGKDCTPIWQVSRPGSGHQEAIFQS
jgi:hypothetical protein